MQSQDMNQTSGNMGLYVFEEFLIEKVIALESLENGLCVPWLRKNISLLGECHQLNSKGISCISMKECHVFKQMIPFFLMFLTSPTRSVQIWVVFQVRTGRVDFFWGGIHWRLLIQRSWSRSFPDFKMEQLKGCVFLFLSLRYLQIEDGYEEVIAQSDLIHQLLMGDVICNHCAYRFVRCHEEVLVMVWISATVGVSVSITSACFGRQPLRLQGFSRWAWKKPGC